MTKKYICLLLVFCWLLGCSGTGWAAAVQVTTDELTQLETVFRELKANNAVLMSDSESSKQDLIRALKLLRESQDELTRLSNLLAQLKAESTAARSDLQAAQSELQKANLSFDQFSKEQKKIQSRLKTERTIWQIVAAVAVGFAVKK